MRNTGLEEAQAGIKIAGRNINNLRHADDTTLMAESEGELKSLLMKWKKRVKKNGLNLNIQKTKITVSSPITSWQIDGETMKTMRDFIFLGSKIAVLAQGHTAGKTEQEFEPSSAELRAFVPRNERQRNSVMKHVEFNVPNGDDGDGGGTDNVIIYLVLTAKQPARYQIIWYLKRLMDVAIIIIPIL